MGISMLKLAMKYVTKTKAGAYKYRRVIPERWRHLFNGKREFVRTIGHTEAEAIRAYDDIHKFYQQKFDALRNWEPAAGNPARVTWSQTKADLKAFDTETFKLSGGKDFSEDEGVARDMMADNLIDPYFDASTGEYTDMPTRTEALAKALYSGMNAATMTVGDGFEFYLKEKQKDTPDRAHAQKVRYNRHLKHVIKILGDRAIASLVRQDARDVRDAWIDEGKKPATVERYINDLKAVLSYTARENDIPYINPFQSLEMPPTTAPSHEEVLPLPEQVMAEVEKDLEQRQDQILYQLFTILKFTGARLSEITGLWVSEIHLNTNMPYIEINRRVGRPLKSEWSQRELPLTQSPLAAIRARLKVAKEDQHLFEKFKDQKGETLASARLMKAIRKVTKQHHHRAHSLRHNFRDRGREKLPERLEVRNALEGRPFSAGEGARYGSMKLEWLYEAMVKINGEP